MSRERTIKNSKQNDAFQSLTWGSFFRPACAVFALTLFLFVEALAASHSLHEHFHEDADATNHQCAVTLLSHGLIESADTTSAIVRKEKIFTAQPTPVLLFPASVYYRFLPARGPPACI